MSRELCHWIGAHTTCCIPNGGGASPLVPASDCKDHPGYSEHSGECYIRSPYRQSFFDARRWCQSKGSTLVSILNAQDEIAATEACGREMCWIGLTEEGGDEFTPPDLQVWKWEDGTIMKYANWQRGEPNNYGGKNEAFAFMNLDIKELPQLPRLFTGHWYDAPSNVNAYALCKIPSNVSRISVPNKPAKTPSGKYELLRGQYSPLEARKACGKGKRLAMPKTASEVEDFMVVAKSVGQYLSPETGFFLGGLKGLDGQWIWDDGTPIAEELWYPGQPGNEGGDETQLCTWQTFGGKFHDCPEQGPFSRLRVICEAGEVNWGKDLGKLFSSKSGGADRTQPLRPQGACKGNFRQYGEGCYRLGEKGQDFYTAVEWCRTEGADLVSIHTPEENSVAREICGNRMCWLGLSERGGTATTARDKQIWRWEDGSDIDYSNWHPGEPNNDGGNDERYAFMNLDMPWVPGLPRIHSGAWFDGPKGMKAFAICWEPLHGHRFGRFRRRGHRFIGFIAVLGVLCISVCTCCYFRNRIIALFPYVFGYNRAPSGRRDVSFPTEFGSAVPGAYAAPVSPPVIQGQPVTGYPVKVHETI